MREVKDQLKTIVAVLLSVVVALWLTPGTSSVLADEKQFSLMRLKVD